MSAGDRFPAKVIGVAVFFSLVLSFFSAHLTVTPGGLGWGLLVMALLYPGAALLLQRRFGRVLLPGVAFATILAYALPLGAALATLPLPGRLLALTATAALAQAALPVALATAALWRFELRTARPAPALHLAHGVVAYLAGLPLAMLATMLVRFAV